ncbi:MAG: TIGR00297 family protein [Cyanobacteria bacterium P01_A01_bin.114]
MFGLANQTNPWVLAVGINTGLLAIAFGLPKKLLTPLGYLNAWVLGVLLWGALGWQAFAITMAYFAVGSAVTKVGFAQKEAAGIAEDRGGVRGPGNVWGSALVAAVCALLVMGGKLGGGAAPWASWLILGMVASLATKLSDTSATEVGKAYGQRTFLITTLKPVPRGTEGAVSLEGTLAGIVGSILLAVFAWAIGFIAPIGIVICAIAAFIATTLESLIGATIEGKIPGLTHDVVNIINTLIGALVAIGLAWLMNY